jgi:ammonium transporter, Amt family
VTIENAALLFGASDIATRLSAVEAAAKSAQSAGDYAWMLMSAALVLMMTGPGLALFYGGLVRRKNVLSTMMHSFVMMAAITVIWAVPGYMTYQLISPSSPQRSSPELTRNA